MVAIEPCHLTSYAYPPGKGTEGTRARVTARLTARAAARVAARVAAREREEINGKNARKAGGRKHATPRFLTQDPR